VSWSRVGVGSCCVAVGFAGVGVGSAGVAVGFAGVGVGSAGVAVGFAGVGEGSWGVSEGCWNVGVGSSGVGVVGTTAGKYLSTPSQSFDSNSAEGKGCADAEKFTSDKINPMVTKIEPNPSISFAVVFISLFDIIPPLRNLSIGSQPIPKSVNGYNDFDIRTNGQKLLAH
jgi:hypothetical protein